MSSMEQLRQEARRFVEWGCEGSVNHAARTLGIPQRTLARFVSGETRAVGYGTALKIKGCARKGFITPSVAREFKRAGASAPEEIVRLSPRRVVQMSPAAREVYWACMRRVATDKEEVGIVTVEMYETMRDAVIRANRHVAVVNSAARALLVPVSRCGDPAVLDAALDLQIAIDQETR